MTEAPLRMLMNNLDPEVAENPTELVVYGGIGRAARDWNCYDRIVETLKTLDEEETLLVQSGKPVGVFPTHADAPRVLIANSNLVPHWATWEHFHELDRKGLAMYGQMTAGSWIYIGSQGIVQGTYETFAEMGRRHFGGRLAGKWILTAGFGGMGGAQPLAATMAGANMLAVECRGSRIAKRLETGYVDAQAQRLDEALALLDAPARKAKPMSVGLLGNIVDVLEALLERGITPDALTDQTSAHDPVNGYLPQGWSVEQWDERRAADPRARAPRPSARWRSTSNTCCASRRWACRCSTTATTSARSPATQGVARAFDMPGFVPEYIRPLFCRGIGPFRWAALSGDPEDIYKTDAKVKELIPDDPHLHHWLDMARSRIHFQGLPARICWVGLGQRHRLGLAFNEMVAQRRAVRADRDRPRSPRFGFGREPESRDRGDAGRLGRRLRLAAAQCAAQHRGGATWVSLHHGGGVGMGYSQHSGVVIVCDGTRRGRTAHRARAVERSRHRRHAPCGRRLSDRHRLRPRTGSKIAHDRSAP